MIDPFFPSYDVWSAGETETECHSTMNWMNSDSATQQYAPKGKVGAAVLGNRETRKVKSASWMTVSSHLSVSLVRALLVNLPPAVSAARLRDLEQSPHQSCDWRKIRLHCDIFIFSFIVRALGSEPFWCWFLCVSLRSSLVCTLPFMMRRCWAGPSGSTPRMIWPTSPEKSPWPRLRLQTLTPLFHRSSCSERALCGSSSSFLPCVS